MPRGTDDAVVKETGRHPGKKVDPAKQLERRVNDLMRQTVKLNQEMQTNHSELHPDIQVHAQSAALNLMAIYAHLTGLLAPWDARATESGVGQSLRHELKLIGRDLPPSWDGEPVRWSQWKSGPELIICPTPPLTEIACDQCGVIDNRPPGRSSTASATVWTYLLAQHHAPGNLDS